MKNENNGNFSQKLLRIYCFDNNLDLVTCYLYFAFVDIFPEEVKR